MKKNVLASLVVLSVFANVAPAANLSKGSSSVSRPRVVVIRQQPRQVIVKKTVVHHYNTPTQQPAFNNAPQGHSTAALVGAAAVGALAGHALTPKAAPAPVSTVSAPSAPVIVQQPAPQVASAPIQAQQPQTQILESGHVPEVVPVDSSKKSEEGSSWFWWVVLGSILGAGGFAAYVFSSNKKSNIG